MRENVNEEILYTIANNLEKVNAPIAIKGGLLLHASLSEHQSPINRKTMDIDANWINQPPNINDMQNILEQAVKLSYPDYTVTTHRPYGTQQSAGFHVIDEKGRIFTHIDIDVQKETHPKSAILKPTNIPKHPICTASATHETTEERSICHDPVPKT